MWKLSAFLIAISLGLHLLDNNVNGVSASERKYWRLFVAKFSSWWLAEPAVRCTTEFLANQKQSRFIRLNDLSRNACTTTVYRFAESILSVIVRATRTYCTKSKNSFFILIRLKSHRKFIYWNFCVRTIHDFLLHIICEFVYVVFFDSIHVVQSVQLLFCSRLPYVSGCVNMGISFNVFVHTRAHSIFHRKNCAIIKLSVCAHWNDFLRACNTIPMGKLPTHLLISTFKLHAMDHFIVWLPFHQHMSMQLMIFPLSL